MIQPNRISPRTHYRRLCDPVLGMALGELDSLDPRRRRDRPRLYYQRDLSPDLVATEDSAKEEIGRRGDVLVSI